MPIKKALYYPYIEIQDETWLKNSLLYWDKIQTIVPDSIENPYETITGLELSNANILKPYYVNSGMDEIENLTGEVIQYLTTPEGQGVLQNKDTNDQDYYIYTAKLPNSIKKLLKTYKMDESKDAIKLNRTFTDFYMTLLATNISSNINAELLTDTNMNDKLATRVKLDYDPLNHPNVSEGTLVNMIFKNIEIDPETPVSKIISFKDDHSYEILKFRNKIVELSDAVSNSSVDEIYENTEYTYKQEFLPELNSLKEELRDNNILCAGSGLMSVSSISTHLMQSPKTDIFEPVAILTLIGVSLIATKIFYNYKKRSILRKNPYSYILSLEDAFR